MPTNKININYTKTKNQSQQTQHIFLGICNCRACLHYWSASVNQHCDTRQRQLNLCISVGCLCPWQYWLGLAGTTTLPSLEPTIKQRMVTHVLFCFRHSSDRTIQRRMLAGPEWSDRHKTLLQLQLHSKQQISSIVKSRTVEDHLWHITYSTTYMLLSPSKIQNSSEVF